MRFALVSTFAVLACVACGRDRPGGFQPSEPPSANGANSGGQPAANPESDVLHAPARHVVGRSLLLLTEVSALQALSRSGLALSERLGLKTAASDLATLSSVPRFELVLRTLEAEIRELAAKDPSAGVGVARFSHRLFDVRWLRQERTRFELIAISLRPDRSPFLPGTGGELRLVYRMVSDSDTGQRVSPLPFTLALEYPLPESSRPLAAFSIAEALKGEALAQHLSRPGGPLERAYLNTLEARHRMTVNLQAVRWPSSVRPDLGGHAEYLLRSFEFTPEGYRPGKLENTPDVARIRSDAPLRSELLAWLRAPEHWSALDQGTLLLPERFLATESSSFSPRGLARLANRPFSQLFAAQDFEGLSFETNGFVQSAEAALRRLDGLTCAGCHQARSVAGFHLLGEDTPDDLSGNRLMNAVSPHLAEDLARREHIFQARLGGHRADFRTPFPERGSAALGGYGDHCGLGDDPSFSKWKCRPEFICTPVDEAMIGQCLPRSQEAGGAGDPCEPGLLTWNPNPARDRVATRARITCRANAVCNKSAVGFPAGMCTETCTDLSSAARCGRIAVLDPFNACLAQKKPFATCLARHSAPAGLRSCDAKNTCRDDYVCAKDTDSGSCIPPYFLFQLRVDGHE